MELIVNFVVIVLGLTFMFFVYEIWYNRQERRAEEKKNKPFDHDKLAEEVFGDMLKRKPKTQNND